MNSSIFTAAEVEFYFTSNGTHSNDMLCETQYFRVIKETLYSLLLFI